MWWWWSVLARILNEGLDVVAAVGLRVGGGEMLRVLENLLKESMNKFVAVI